MSFPQVAACGRAAVLTALITLAAITPALAQDTTPVPPVQPPRSAQPDDRIPVFVFDARGAMAMLKQSAATAASFGVPPESLPGRGFGLVGGVHVYPFRRGHFAFGVGSELLLTRASKQEKDDTGMPVGTAIQRRLQSFSGQVSFNFGHRNGWSYLSGGIGPVNFDTYLAGDMPDGLRPSTLNYGAGARWFNTDHLAFSVDMRFYATSPATPTLVVGERARQTVLVLSVGIAIK
jgi:hypothetical protein